MTKSTQNVTSLQNKTKSKLRQPTTSCNLTAETPRTLNSKKHTCTSARFFESYELWIKICAHLTSDSGFDSERFCLQHGTSRSELLLQFVSRKTILFC